MPVKCPNCGRVNPDRTAFCAGCGTATWPPPEGCLLTEEEAAALAPATAEAVTAPAAAPETSAAEVEATWEAMVQARQAARAAPPSSKRWTCVGLALLVGVALAVVLNLVGSRYMHRSGAGGTDQGESGAAPPGTVTFARAVDADGRPLRTVTLIHAGDPSPVCVVELPAGTKRRARSLSLRWLRDGAPAHVFPQDVPLPESLDQPIIFPVGLPDNAEPGEYAMEASLGDTLVAADTLKVLPPGS